MASWAWAVVSGFVALLAYAACLPALLLSYLAMWVPRLLRRSRCCGGLLHMDALDATWLQEASAANPTTITAMIVIDRCSLAHVKELVHERWLNAKTKHGALRFPRLRQRVVLSAGQFFWQPLTDLDLEYHFSPQIAPSKEHLNGFIASLLTGPLDRNHPLWRFFVIEDYHDNKSAVVFRVHHCMADGVALVRMLVEVLADAGVEMKVVSGRSKSSWFMTMLRGLLYMPLSMLLVLFGRTDRGLLHPGAVDPYRTAEWDSSIKVSTVKALAQKLGVSLNDVMLGLLAGALRNHQFRRHANEDVRLVVNALARFSVPHSPSISEGPSLGKLPSAPLSPRVTEQVVSDIHQDVPATEVEAKLLSDMAEHTDQQGTEDGVPSPSVDAAAAATAVEAPTSTENTSTSGHNHSISDTTVTVAAVDATSDSKADSLALPPAVKALVPPAPSGEGIRLSDVKIAMPVNLRPAREPIVMNNQFAAALFDLPVSMGGTPSMRVLEVHRRTQFLFDTAAPLGFFFANVALVTCLPKMIAGFFLDLFANKCTAVVTNVPGPSAPLALNQKQLHDAAFYVPQRASIGLGVSMLTYNGRLFLGFNAAKNVVPNAGDLTLEFLHEYSRLCTETHIDPDA